MANISVDVQVDSDAPTTDSETSTDRGDWTDKMTQLDEFYSRKTRQTRYARSTKRDEKLRAKLQRFTLVFRRILSANGLPQRVEVDIHAPKLTAVLRDIFRDAATLMLGESDESPVMSPETLFLAWKDLEKRKAEEKCKPSPDHELLDDLSVILSYLQRDHGMRRKQLEGLTSEGLITFELLFSLFKPNSTLYTNKNTLREHQVMKFISGSYGEDQRKQRVYKMRASFITHDGESLGWARLDFDLPFFEGNLRITDLRVFPLDMHPENKSIRLELTDRGRFFNALVQEPACKWYGATAVYAKQGRSWEGSGWEEVKFLASKRVMVDPPTWAIHCYDILNRPKVPYNSHLPWVDDENLIFCNHRVLGFSFEEKRWGAFAVSKLKQPMWNEAAFDKVIMPSGQPSRIRDLMRGHRMRSVTSDSENLEDGDDDIIKGKGQGLLGLLSGNPGVGKTVTAEAVAEVLQRPLYTVSAGDLGIEVTKVDEKLSQALDIIRRWGCVLLIDEADVFLHRRDNNVSLERNAIVSIFLRRLEYFRGVAILTTNRMEDVDDAFMSRFHFKFKYKDLELHTMVNIWKNFLAKEISRPGGHIKGTDLEQLAKEYPMSGREIKNAAFCAKAISRARKQELSLKIVRDTIENLGYASEATRTEPLSSLKRKRQGD